MQAYGKEEGAFARAWNVVKAPFLIWNSCLASLREGEREGVGLQTATGRLARAPTQLAQRRLWFWRGPKKARYAAFAPKMRNHIIIWMQTERAHSSTKPPPPGRNISPPAAANWLSSACGISKDSYSWRSRKGGMEGA